MYKTLKLTVLLNKLVMFLNCLILEKYRSDLESKRTSYLALTLALALALTLGTGTRTLHGRIKRNENILNIIISLKKSKFNLRSVLCTSESFEKKFIVHS